MPLLVLRFVPLALALCGTTFLGVAIGLTASAEKTRSLADYITSICADHFRDASHEEAPFLTDNASAMSKMMVDMGITPSGDIDRDFVAMMVPHHQGAVEMAQAELRYGRNERLRRMAQEIVVTQQQEIAAMHLALGKALEGSTSARNQQTLMLNGAQPEVR
jgi:hypothetical protein